jgi:serine/threonine protein kinase/DNA-binding CsgD family transcriptional regulator
MKVGHKLLNRYRIEELIGEGATATVYRAVDERLGRIVAVKVLLPYVRSTARERFSREAQSAAALNHPNIMAIHDEATEDDWHFLVVEYVEGKPLNEFIPSPPDTVTRIGIQLCNALDYAHRMNIIHRDIKPANVKITSDGLVKIMDFGLAMARDAKHITAHGSIIGTPAYLSPEQARGHKLDHRTDIYSLGVMLYEMVTGQLPFDSNDISALLLQKVTKDPLSPHDLVPETPEALNTAIMKAINREPDLRFQTGAEFALALGQEPSERITDETPLPAASTVSKADQPTEETPVGKRQKPITLIVADDHVILRTSVAFYLDDQPDIQVLAEAGSGTEVLDLFQRHSPDILLLDLNMPDKSGLDILPIIRKSHPSTRVLVLTGRAEDAYIMRALQAGAHGYLLKTSPQEELLEAVYKVADGNMALGSDVTERVVSGLLTPTDRDPLNDKERDVLLCIVAGIEKNDAIAKKLGCSEAEVVDRLSRSIDKLGAGSRTQAALIALRAGWISLEEAHQR